MCFLRVSLCAILVFPCLVNRHRLITMQVIISYAVAQSVIQFSLLLLKESLCLVFLTVFVYVRATSLLTKGIAVLIRISLFTHVPTNSFVDFIFRCL